MNKWLHDSVQELGRASVVLGLAFWMSERPSLDPDSQQNFSKAMDRIPFLREITISKRAERERSRERSPSPYAHRGSNRSVTTISESNISPRLSPQSPGKYDDHHVKEKSSSEHWVGGRGHPARLDSALEAIAQGGSDLPGSRDRDDFFYLLAAVEAAKGNMEAFAAVLNDIERAVVMASSHHNEHLTPQQVLTSLRRKLEDIMRGVKGRMVNELVLTPFGCQLIWLDDETVQDDIPESPYKKREHRNSNKGNRGNGEDRLFRSGDSVNSVTSTISTNANSANTRRTLSGSVQPPGTSSVAAMQKIFDRQNVINGGNRDNGTGGNRENGGGGSGGNGGCGSSGGGGVSGGYGERGDGRAADPVSARSIPLSVLSRGNSVDESVQTEERENREEYPQQTQRTQHAQLKKGVPNASNTASPSSDSPKRSLSMSILDEIPVAERLLTVKQRIALRAMGNHPSSPSYDRPRGQNEISPSPHSDDDPNSEYYVGDGGDEIGFRDRDDNECASIVSAKTDSNLSASQTKSALQKSYLRSFIASPDHLEEEAKTGGSPTYESPPRRNSGFGGFNPIQPVRSRSNERSMGSGDRRGSSKGSERVSLEREGRGERGDRGEVGCSLEFLTGALAQSNVEKDGNSSGASGSHHGSRGGSGGGSRGERSGERGDEGQDPSAAEGGAVSAIAGVIAALALVKNADPSSLRGREKQAPRGRDTERTRPRNPLEYPNSEVIVRLNEDEHSSYLDYNDIYKEKKEKEGEEKEALDFGRVFDDHTERFEGVNPMNDPNSPRGRGSFVGADTNPTTSRPSSGKFRSGKEESGKELSVSALEIVVPKRPVVLDDIVQIPTGTPPLPPRGSANPLEVPPRGPRDPVGGMTMSPSPLTDQYMTPMTEPSALSARLMAPVIPVSGLLPSYLPPAVPLSSLDAPVQTHIQTQPSNASQPSDASKISSHSSEAPTPTTQSGDTTPVITPSDEIELKRSDSWMTRSMYFGEKEPGYNIPYLTIPQKPASFVPVRLTKTDSFKKRENSFRIETELAVTYPQQKPKSPHTPPVHTARSDTELYYVDNSTDEQRGKQRNKSMPSSNSYASLGFSASYSEPVAIGRHKLTKPILQARSHRQEDVIYSVSSSSPTDDMFGLSSPRLSAMTLADGSPYLRRNTLGGSSDRVPVVSPPASDVHSGTPASSFGRGVPAVRTGSLRNIFPPLPSPPPISSPSHAAAAAAAISAPSLAATIDSLVKSLGESKKKHSDDLREARLSKEAVAFRRLSMPVTAKTPPIVNDDEDSLSVGAVRKESSTDKWNIDIRGYNSEAAMEIKSRLHHTPSKIKQLPLAGGLSPSGQGVQGAPSAALDMDSTLKTLKTLIDSPRGQGRGVVGESTSQDVRLVPSLVKLATKKLEVGTTVLPFPAAVGQEERPVIKPSIKSKMQALERAMKSPTASQKERGSFSAE